PATTSSALAIDPSMRYARPSRRRRYGSKLAAGFDIPLGELTPCGPPKPPAPAPRPDPTSPACPPPRPRRLRPCQRRTLLLDTFARRSCRVVPVPLERANLSPECPSDQVAPPVFNGETG